MKRFFHAVGSRLLFIVFSFFTLQSAALYADTFSSIVDGDGNISFPENFREDMIHLGSWFVPEGSASGFHDVYMSREDVKSYKETGVYPDGSIIVKELRASSDGTYTTGVGVAYANDTIKQWFVMIKDSKNRFSVNNPVWGDGWGWALFKPSDLTTNLTKSYKSDCLACHIPAKTNDWIYLEAYPTLKSN